MYKFLIKRLIRWFVGKDKDVDFDQIVDWVRIAETTNKIGTEKALLVKNQISELINILIPWIIDLLVALAVAYATKMGWINQKK